MYYAQLVVDPANADRIYVMNVFIQVSDDGGKTLRRARRDATSTSTITTSGSIPKNTNHYLVGCDGGIYESFDRGANWIFKANLPIDQFYDVAVDERAPFYHVYGGTQDNITLGGPARTRNVHGITNADWFVTSGGDGFHSRVDPKDPNTIYAELQYGGLVALRPPHRRARRHPAAARQGRAALALELGLAADHQPARAHAPLLRAPTSSSAATTAATPGRPSAPTSPASSTATSCR